MKKSFVWSVQCSRGLVFMISALLNIAVLNSSSNLNRDWCLTVKITSFSVTLFSVILCTLTLIKTYHLPAIMWGRTDLEWHRSITLEVNEQKLWIYCKNNPLFQIYHLCEGGHFSHTTPNDSKHQIWDFRHLLFQFSVDFTHLLCVSD